MTLIQLVFTFFVLFTAACSSSHNPPSQPDEGIQSNSVNVNGDWQGTAQGYQLIDGQQVAMTCSSIFISFTQTDVILNWHSLQTQCKLEQAPSESDLFNMGAIEKEMSILGTDLLLEGVKQGSLNSNRLALYANGNNVTQFVRMTPNTSGGFIIEINNLNDSINPVFLKGSLILKQ